MKIKFAIIVSILNFLLWPISSPGAGVTIITHGLNGNADGWVSGMANQIPNRSDFPGTSYTFYKLFFIPATGGGYNLTWSRLAGSAPSATDSGEIIIALDWSQLADGNSFNTYQIANVVAAQLMNPSFISELNGHALCELPIHLIGHSRGGSLMCETSRVLGTSGVWVDHLTTLDPHPLNGANFSLDALLYSAVDAPTHTYQNVLFHDNYWQDIAFIVYGEPVSGAYVRQLTYLIGGYSSDHSDVHLWYHGTVDERNPANDTEAQLTGTEFGSWYSPNENYSYDAGFKWSLIGGGDRTSFFYPQGGGYPSIRDGYNQTWDLGAGASGNRTLLPAIYNAWPDVIKFNLTGANSAQQGQTNVSVKISYQWAQPASSNATLSVYLDNDYNPLNANQTFIGQFSAAGSGLSSSLFAGISVNLSLNATNAPIGYHVLYAKITGGGKTRYLYAPEIIQVLPAVRITTQPSSQTVWAGSNVTFNLTASGVPTLKYQWRKNGSNITGATNANFTTNNVTALAAGTYSCLVSNLFGNATSSNAVLTVLVPDTTRPTNIITAPTAGQRWSDSLFNMTGTAGDNAQVSNVWYQINGLGWNLAATGNNWSNWSGQVTLMPGTNTLTAYSVDTSGNFSPTNSVSFQFVVTNQIQVFANGLGSIAPNYNNAWLEIGRSYSMTATPATGFMFTNWTGSLMTSAATLNFTMASNLMFIASFIDTNKPLLSITNLVAGQRWSSAVFTVRGTAGDNWQVGNVWYQLNGLEWSNAVTVTAWTNWSAALNLVPGTNSIKAYAIDSSGIVSTTNSVSFDFVVTNQLQIRITGKGTVSPNYSNGWLEIGRNYSITSTPASGFMFTNWLVSSNWIGGALVTGTNLPFMMQSNLTLQANFLDVAKPTLTITTPTNGQKMVNALAIVNGTAADNWQISNVWYQLNGGAWSTGTTANSFTNWTTTAPLIVGTNSLKAFALDLGGNISATNSVSFVSSNTFKLQMNFALTQPLTTTGLNFNLQISPGLNGHIQVSTNLAAWNNWTNFVGTNITLNFRDPASTNSQQRFYRAVIP